MPETLREPAGLIPLRRLPGGGTSPALVVFLAATLVLAVPPAGLAQRAPGTAWEKLYEEFSRSCPNPPYASSAIEAMRFGEVGQATVEAAWGRSAGLEKLLQQEIVPVARAAAADWRAGRNAFSLDLAATAAPPLDLRAVNTFLGHLAWLSWSRFVSGQQVKALQLGVRLLRVGQELTRSSRSFDQLCTGLVSEMRAYRLLAEQLVEARLTVPQAGQLEAALGDFWKLRTTRRVLAETLRRERVAKEASLRSRVTGKTLSLDTAKALVKGLREYDEVVRQLLSESAPLALDGKLRAYVKQFDAGQSPEQGRLLSELRPNVSAVGREILINEALSALLLAAASVARLRAETGRLPPGSELGLRLPEDPWSQKPLSCYVAGDGVMLASTGDNGRLDGFDPKKDVLVASTSLDRRARRLFSSEIKPCSYQAILGVRLPAEADESGPLDRSRSCEVARTMVEKALRDFLEKHQVEFLRPTSVSQPLLVSNGLLDRRLGCPNGGLWRLDGQALRCAHHTAGADPSRALDLEEGRGKCIDQMKAVIHRRETLASIQCPAGGKYLADHPWGIRCSVHPWSP